MSGNRLAGDDGNRGADDERVAARLDDDLAERWRAYTEQSDESKSAAVRNALDDYLPDPNAETGHPEPDDAVLAKAYNALRSRHEGYVMRQSAESVIAQELGRAGLGSDAVWKEVLKPLSKQGWVSTTTDSHFSYTYVKAVVPQQVAASGSQEVAPADD